MAAARLPKHTAEMVVLMRQQQKMSWRKIGDALDISPSGAMYAYQRATQPPEPEPELEYTGKKTGPKSKSNSKDWSEYEGANWVPALRRVFGSSVVMEATQ